MVAVYGAGTIDNLFTATGERFAIMSRQLRHVMRILYDVPMPKEQGEVSHQEGRAMTRKVLKKLGIKAWF
jgi:hypothetical protein